MSQQLEYQEYYRKLGHESVIKAMVLSPDGRRLVTGSDDSTVLMWSTQSGAILCRIQAHSPVLSLAWLKNSKGFIFGCKNGVLVSVIMTERYVETSYFRGHNAAVCCISPKFNDISPISAAMDDVRIWTRTTGQTEGQVERWELKVKLDSPSIVNLRHKVEVTSVNWEDEAAAARISRVLVSYRWHGIVCWDVTKMTVVWHIPMDECGSFSLSPNGRFAATFGLSKYFEVRELRLGTTQSMQWKPSKKGAKAQLTKNQPVCFAHEGFAVAGAAGEAFVVVWDAESGDQLLSLDHGEGSKVRTLVTAFLDGDSFLIVTGTERQGKHYVFLWVTAPCNTMTYTIAGQKIELGFAQNFWIHASFIVVLVALSVGWMVYYMAKIATAV